MGSLEYSSFLHPGHLIRTPFTMDPSRHCSVISKPLNTRNGFAGGGPYWPNTAHNEAPWCSGEGFRKREQDAWRRPLGGADTTRRTVTLHIFIFTVVTQNTRHILSFFHPSFSLSPITFSLLLNSFLPIHSIYYISWVLFSFSH